MRLSDVERRILAAAELRADATIEELSERTNLGVNSIRYALKKLEGRGMIRRVPFVDLYPLGYTDFVTFFSLATKHHSQEREQFLQTLIASPLVTWIGELGGQYQYGAAIFAKNVAQFVSFLEQISTQFDGIVIKKTVRLTKRFTRYNRTYLDPSIPKDSFIFGVSDKTATLDATDDKILGIMTDCPEYSASHQAKQLGLPLSTFQHRVRQLKHRGILLGQIYAIDIGYLGVSFYNLQVAMSGLSRDQEQNLHAWADKHPNVVHLIECVGEWDFEIGLEVEVPEGITGIISELYNLFGQAIVRVDTIPIFRNRKYVFFSPTSAVK